MFGNSSLAFTRRINLRGIVLTSALVGALGSIGVGGGLAHAAQPNNQGCLGADFSTYARYGTPDGSVLQNEPGSGFGQFNASLAQAVPGLGLPIQIHLSGGIPDWYVANSCNNP